MVFAHISASSERYTLYLGIFNSSLQGISTSEKAIIELVPTSALCPLAIHLAINVKKEVEKIEGLKDVKVYIKGHIMEHRINEAVNK